MTKLEIINETVTFYSEDTTKRARANEDCAYNTEDGRHCAVGRCFTQDLRDLGVNLPFNTGTSAHYLANRLSGSIDRVIGGLDDLLMEEYKGHDPLFWADLQRLHDNNGNWDEDGLSELGQAEVDELIKIYE